MSKYLIELEHEASEQACLNAMQIFLSSGSHFLANAEWGCQDNEHKCWMIVEVDKRDDARSILPPVYRKNAKIVELRRNIMEDVKKTHNTEK